MGGRYGMSFAKKLIEQGDYEEAVASATQEIESGNNAAELFLDRATAYDLLEQPGKSVRDFETALERNLSERVLDLALVDDAYFSALIALAKTTASTEVAASLDRYRTYFPRGAHLSEVDTWKKRISGHLPTLLDKTVEMV